MGQAPNIVAAALQGNEQEVPMPIIKEVCDHNAYFMVGRNTMMPPPPPHSSFLCVL